MIVKTPSGTDYEEFFVPKNTGDVIEGVQMGTSVAPSGYKGEFDKHEGNEFSYIISGEIINYTENGGVYHAKKGDVIFTPAGEGHKFDCVSKEPCRVIWIEVPLKK